MEKRYVGSLVPYESNKLVRCKQPHASPVMEDWSISVLQSATQKINDLSQIFLEEKPCR